MRIERRATQPPDRRSRGRLGLLGVSLALLAVAGVVLLQWRGGGINNSSVTTPSGSAPPSSASSRATGTREEVLSRLHQIFRVRDQAIQRRDVGLLATIYTVDCPCLEGDTQLIQTLKRKRLLWRGIRVSLHVEEAERVNERLWIVNALVVTDAFEIERETGEVVEKIPRGQEFSRFALTMPAGQNDWLLGQASVVENDG